MVPSLVGLLVSWLAVRGFELNAETQAGLVTLLTTAIITLYYSLVTLLERKVNPAFGWLLGMAKAPTYDATSKLDDTSPTGESAAIASPLPNDTPTEETVSAA
jgi:hypothetical protein